ncbi:hypothetical protein J4E93_010007 [Alternaria ventricosa]|uniref:uncharacterized protein n=1 Tax=Alternaria ventricosa TaxID=1187951 RepID=UPI0020C431F0|nr:uncharacterized protein J4E93_010007 [Alternaria ventricosa]KAI4638453.1 hypothetical protein J4E93_010007 [Alternaria ventricosa]
MDNDNAGLATARRRNTRLIAVEEIGTISLAELLWGVSQSTHNYPSKLETIDALNAIMAYGLSSQSRITTAAGNVFYPFSNHPQAEMIELDGGIHAHCGYFTSLRTSVSRLLVNVNVTTGAFYKLFVFFLLAYQGLHGTSRPAHCVLSKDKNIVGADQLQNLTHNLCYTFASATRSVSICPPA